MIYDSYFAILIFIIINVNTIIVNMITFFLGLQLYHYFLLLYHYLFLYYYHYYFYSSLLLLFLALILSVVIIISNINTVIFLPECENAPPEQADALPPESSCGRSWVSSSTPARNRRVARFLLETPWSSSRPRCWTRWLAPRLSRSCYVPWRGSGGDIGFGSVASERWGEGVILEHQCWTP